VSPEQSLAAVLVETAQPLRAVHLTLPSLKPGQVLVNVAYSGICHTQLHEALGHRGQDRYLPHAMGHEGSGIVAAVSDGVKKVKVGDRVVLSWLKGSGADVPSTVYHSEFGPVNSGAVATFMTKTVVAENRVTPISGDMPLREAALLGCAIPTGAGAVLNAGDVHAGDSVVIWGVGGIGLCAVLAAAMVGANPIIAVDVYEHKLEMAKSFGATHSVNARTIDPVMGITECTGGQGVDFAIECAGLKTTIEAAFRAIRAGGGLCILVGHPPNGTLIEIDPFDLIRGKRIMGTWGGESQMDRDIPFYVSRFMEGKLPWGRLITHEYPLAQVNQALQDLAEGKVGRALLNTALP